MTVSEHQRIFRAHVYAHYKGYGRQLPWRPPFLCSSKGVLEPYRVLVSEIMLQQTPVARVVPKYHAFIQVFPDLSSLGRASVRDVLTLWIGLGYNRRALLLKRTAEILARDFNAVFPRDSHELQKLPGIGPYTAAALACFAFNQPVVMIETNIRTVFLHHFFSATFFEKSSLSSAPRDLAIHDREIIPLIEKTLDRDHPREWYYALMDYGAHLKRTAGNPNRASKHYTRQKKFAGSQRDIRGHILRILLVHSRDETSFLAEFPKEKHQQVLLCLCALEREGMIRKNASVFSIQS